MLDQPGDIVGAGMAVIPSKADLDKQREFLYGKLEPLPEEEKQGKRRVFFVDAAHFVMGAFLGMLWCFERLFLKSSSERLWTFTKKQCLYIIAITRLLANSRPPLTTVSIR